MSRTKKLTLSLLMTLVLLIFTEGLLSFWMVLKPRPEQGVERSGSTIRYDPDLGWSHEKSSFVPNMFGPNIGATINEQGFRARLPRYTPGPRPGQLRIVCSGDSFTFGYGVDDNHAWPYRLQTLHEQIETINMGQIGYGIDQAYLWYKRDGVAFQHHVHLMSFITADFQRMGTRDFLGYGKPWLSLGPDGRLQTSNVPVPEGAYRLPFWLVDYGRQFKELRMVQWVRSFMTPVRTQEEIEMPEAKEVLDIALAVFEDLDQINRAKGSQLVLVYLPINMDLKSESSTFWRQGVREAAEKKGWIFWDLVEEIRDENKSPAKYKKLFRGDGHYNEEGNALISGMIYARLQQLSAAQEFLR